MSAGGETARFAIGVMMLADREAAHRFVDYHLAAGAAAIHIVWDGTVPNWMRDLDPRVEVIDAEATFWSGQGVEKPGRNYERQWVIYPWLAKRCEADWIVFVDSDEFLHPAETIATVLGAIPATVGAISFPVAEAAFGPGDNPREVGGATHFRRVIRSRHWLAMGPILYGRDRRVMRKGVLGHILGKHAVRPAAAEGLELRAHRAYRDGRDASVPIEAIAGHRALEVLHFDAMGYGPWREKLAARVEGRRPKGGYSPERRAQIELAREAFVAGGDAPMRLMTRLYGLSPMQARLLTAGDWLLRARPFG